MENLEVLKMLFEQHHQQYSTRWQNVASTARGTIATFTLFTGWILLSKDDPSEKVIPWLVLFISVFGIFSMIYVLVSIKNIRKIASVIEKINYALGFYEIGKYIPNETLYLSTWKGFGSRHKWAVIGYLILMSVSAIMALGAVFSRL